MVPNKNTGEIITEEVARELISSFTNNYPGEVTSSFIGSTNVQNILDQENCIGVRIYNGYDAVTQKLSLVLVGVDEDEKEILEGGIIYDRLLPCPDICPIDGLGY